MTKTRKLCPHDQQKYFCRECGGSQICKHGNRKSRCKECGGSEICKHGCRRSRCKECDGSEICKHGRQKPQCKECGGSEICKHGHRKSRCKECGGSEICKHGHRKSQCKECGGSGICKHGRQKHQCFDCGTGLCPKCGLWQTKGKLCATCDPTSRKRKRYDENRTEIKMLQFLQEKIPWANVYSEQQFGAPCGYKGKKYDCVIFSKTQKYVIVIECDEQWHSSPSYTETCEWSRPFAAYDIFEKLTLFVRWNPDAWKVDGKTIRVTKKNKMETLWEYIRPYITEEQELNDKLKVTFIYYPTTTSTENESINPINEMTNEELECKMKMFFR